jgi:hypothetical protein
MKEDERQVMGAYQGQDPLKVVEECASAGSWVFISSIRFPTYWQKLSTLVQNLTSQGKVKNTFRLFIDLQGFSHSEIPDSFLFNHSLSYYLHEKNNSEVVD